MKKRDMRCNMHPFNVIAISCNSQSDSQVCDDHLGLLKEEDFYLLFGPLVASEKVRDDALLPGVSVGRQVDGAAWRHVDEMVPWLRQQQTAEQSLEDDESTNKSVQVILQTFRGIKIFFSMQDGNIRGCLLHS